MPNTATDRDSALSPPCRHQRVDRSNLFVRQPIRSAGEQPAPDHPQPQRRVEFAHRRDVESIPGQGASQLPAGEHVERLGVLAQRDRSAGERLGDPAAEHLFQQWQHLRPKPHPGESGIGVVRVGPGGQAQFGAGGMGEAASQAQQRSEPGRIGGTHAGDRAGTGAATQAQQHGLGLVVEGVAEQHRFRAAGGVQRGVPRGAGGGLGPAFGAHSDGQHPGLDATEVKCLPARRPRDRFRAGDQTVVDDEGHGGQDCRGGGRQRQRVRAARQRHAPRPRLGQPARGEVGQRAAQPVYSTRSIHRCGFWISSGSGSVAGPVQTVLNRSMPTLATTWSTKALPRVY